MSDSRQEERIRKLLAMADHPNSNPEEAASAATMAANLALQYQIDLEKLRETSGDRAAGYTISEEGMGYNDTLFMRTRDKQAAWVLAMGVSKLFLTSPLCYCWQDGKMVMRFFGRESPVKLSVAYFAYLWNSNKRGCTEHMARAEYTDKATMRSARKSFRFGFSMAVGTRLAEKAMERMQKGVQTAEGSSNALVVVSIVEREEQAVALYRQKQAPNAKQGKTAKQSRSVASALKAGAEKGSQVGLDEQVSHEKRPARKAVA